LDLTRRLEVKIRVDEGKEKFMPGMSVDVTIVANEKEDVLYVPTETLVRGEYAYAVEGEYAVRRLVKTGVGNWRTIEVLDGLNEGDVIITSLSSQALDGGVRVRVVDKLEE